MDIILIRCLKTYIVLHLLKSITKVDALPGVTLKGHVDSLSPASGVSYSTIDAHNATGNFTKIAQRLPVKISLDAKQPLLSQLRVGMSVVPTIDVVK
ncbi:multidrug transporter [Pseudoalteromonas sp. SR41-1]|uniref:HlyD family secretion protein n=1 Tax=Pseudoalteromonas sp. SR41-1 TaxID=2760952 RepID=UPI002175D32D|nr:multidrug transporter [Pseudoalteromonas sp. SR41-1]